MKIFEIGEKYYFEDLGLHNSIQHFDFRKDINKLMENVVCIDLLRYGYEVYVGKSGNKEIDFIASKDDHKVYIQVAYMLPDDATVQREFGNLLEIADNYPNMWLQWMKCKAGEITKELNRFHCETFCWQRIKKDCKSII